MQFTIFDALGYRRENYLQLEQNKFVPGIINTVRNEQWVDRGKIHGKKIQANRKTVSLELTLYIIYIQRTDRRSEKQIKLRHEWFLCFDET